MRKVSLARKTAETDIQITLDLDGTGKSEISTGAPFLDHMLTLFAKHGRFDLFVKCIGDNEVDDHHTTEDIGILLGEAFYEALGDKKGIRRYGDITLPMDEALILAAVDISGRGFLAYDAPTPRAKVGTFDTELSQEFFYALAINAKITLHVKELAGQNSHHIIEGVFKAVARALRTAVSMDPDALDEVPSTKGVLS